MKTEIEDKAAEEWLNSQKKATFYPYRSHWRRFVKFTGMTGTEILASRQKDKEFFWEKKVSEFKTWLIDEEGLGSYSATSATFAIRGFFAYHRVPLQLRKSERTKMAQRSRKTEDYLFSLEDLRKSDEVADLEEKYVLRAGKSFGLRAGDFLRLSRGDLEPYIGNEPPISIGTYKTQKEEGIVAYPFIDADAQPIIKLMLEKMTRDGRTGQKERMLEFTKEIQLSRNLRRAVQKAGINTGNKQVRFHCLRKFLIDHLSSFMSESKWKQIVGKKISESAYVSPDTLHEDYARTMLEITFTKRADEDVQAIAKLEALKIFAKASGRYTDKDIAKIKMRKPRNLAEEIEELEKLVAEKNHRETNGGTCEDGKHCLEFAQIQEAELLERLKNGWEIVKELSDGQLIVKHS